jgi:N-ethylmaleimide reductase
MFSHFRPHHRGALIDNVAMTREPGKRPHRRWFGFAARAPIQRSDRALHYTPGPHGYTDYPFYDPAGEAGGD